MGVGDALSPAGDMIGGGFAKLAQYWWVLFIFVGIAVMVGGVYIIKTIKANKKQWTHKLIIRRVLQNNVLSAPFTHKMRRFPLIKRAEVFELEKPLLGGYLIPELDQYSGVNEYSIIIDKNNRIYINTGEYFNPDKSSVQVSAKHAEIDIGRADLRADYQDINKVTKRADWGQVAKAVMWSLLIVAIMIVGIVGFGEWGDSHIAKAQAAEAEAQAMSNLAEAMGTSQATANTQIIILDMLKEIKGTNNIQGNIKELTE